MVLILKGHTEIGAHVLINLGFLISLRRIFLDREQPEISFFFKEDIFLFIRAQFVMSYHQT